MNAISSAPSPTLSSPRPATPTAAAGRDSAPEPKDQVQLGPTDYSQLYGLHTLQAYPENGGPAAERSQQLASGGRWLTEAASLKSISNPQDPVSLQRRQVLLDTLRWAHDNHLKVNMRLDYDWGQNVPTDEAGRQEYARLLADFVRDARSAAGPDTVANWVIGNEPNLAHENGGKVLPPAAYVAAVRAVRERLDQDPATRGANLASAGLSPGGSDPQGYFAQMLDAGLGQWVGTYGVHEYADRLDNLDAYDRLAQQRGVARPLAITEFGVPRQGINALQQSEQTNDFIRKIAQRNGRPGASPVQNVTLWKANRGPGEEAYSLTPELLQGLGRLGEPRTDTSPLLQSLAAPPVAGPGPSAAAWPGPSVAAGQPASNGPIRAFKPRRRRRPRGGGGFPPAPTAGLTAAPPTRPVGIADPTSPYATLSNALLPPRDPSRPFAVSYILENRDPRLPDNPPGIEGFIKDAAGRPVDARKYTVRFDGGAEPFYIPIVSKAEKGPGFFEIPVVVPPGFKGRYNVAIGTGQGNEFKPMSNTANVEVTRDHRRTQIHFQEQSGNDIPSPSPSSTP
ncbi:MAG: hypothetical protein U0931_13970 [Vulcanimicrobiota bacterium]